MTAAGALCIVQARMGSTRLPGKVLMELAGRPVLALVLARLSRSRRIGRVVVATTTQAEDDAIVAACAALDVAVHRGPLDDVLARYAGAAARFGGDPVVRVTSDCPLIDPDVIDAMLASFDPSACDYLSNAIERSFPRGLDAEVFSRAALQRAHREAGQPHEREHVTPYLYQHPERFRLAHYRRDDDRSALRWTLDTPEDYEFLRAFVQRLGDRVVEAGIDELLRSFDGAPELGEINRHIQQKSLHA